MKTIEIKSWRGHAQALSGLFINQDNPTGISPRELDFLAILLYALRGGKREVTPAVKSELVILTEQTPQIVTNYIKKFRDKGILDKKNMLSLLFLEDTITMKRVYGTD